jgi:hypothetical protein
VCVEVTYIFEVISLSEINAQLLQILERENRIPRNLARSSTLASASGER